MRSEERARAARFRDWRPRWFGFWTVKGDPDPRIPLLADCIDRAWKPADLRRLVSYLARTPLAITAGALPRACPLCGKRKFDPSAYKFDGEWLWPIDLSHFVAEHGVRLPDELVERIRERDYRPPKRVAIAPSELPFP